MEFHRETASRYDAEVTEEYSVYHERLLWPFLDRVALVHPGGRALDLGCGTGVVTLALAERGFDVVGVDHSEEMLQLARRKLAAAGLEAALETGDVRALRFGDDEFDLLTVQGLLHHLEELGPCLREVARVLRPGGLFYVSEPTCAETPQKRFLRLVWSVLPRRSRPRPERLVETVEAPIDPAELRAELEDAGLKAEFEFLTHVPPLRRHLPDRAYLLASRLLTWPSRRRGDLVFVFGTKPST